MLKCSRLRPPDPPAEHPCPMTLQVLHINNQKELVLRPGDRIWYKSSIYGDRYYDAVINEISPGPGRTIFTDVFESPATHTSIQKFE